MLRASSTSLITSSGVGSESAVMMPSPPALETAAASLARPHGAGLLRASRGMRSRNRCDACEKTPSHRPLFLPGRREIARRLTAWHDRGDFGAARRNADALDRLSGWTTGAVLHP